MLSLMKFPNVDRNVIYSILTENKSTACGCRCSDAAALRNFQVKKGAKLCQKMRITSPTDMGSPF